MLIRNERANILSESLNTYIYLIMNNDSEHYRH